MVFTNNRIGFFEGLGENEGRFFIKGEGKGLRSGERNEGLV